jgi:hypothetical protein
MKRFLIMFFILFSVGLFYAHPPENVALKYDAATKMVIVNITHKIMESTVKNPVKHYIKDVIISVNGKRVISENIVFQQSDDGEACDYLLNVKSGDKISVTASCNISGFKTETINVQ